MDVFPNGEQGKHAVTQHYKVMKILIMFRLWNAVLETIEHTKYVLIWRYIDILFF